MAGEIWVKTFVVYLRGRAGLKTWEVFKWVKHMKKIVKLFGSGRQANIQRKNMYEKASSEMEKRRRNVEVIQCDHDG